MRKRERLCHVLYSLNPEVVGANEAWVLRVAAQYIEHGAPCVDAIRNMVMKICAGTASPHVRELAEEAVHYLEPLPITRTIVET